MPSRGKRQEEDIPHPLDLPNERGAKKQFKPARKRAVMVPLMLFAHLYAVFQLFVLASLSRTVRWRVVGLAFLTGMYASASFALVLQFGWMAAFAAATGQPLRQIMPVASYTIDPFIEEVVKILPVLLFCSIPHVRRQLGITDIILLCAALGSGFGLTEQVFRFSHRTEYAFWSSSDGAWILPLALDPPAIPGMWRSLSSWLPNGVTTFIMVGLVSAPVNQNIHLVWSVVAGLGLGVFVRGRSGAGGSSRCYLSPSLRLTMPSIT